MHVLVATGLYPPEIGGPATYSKLLEGGLPAWGISVTVVPYRRVRKYWKVARHFVYWFLVMREGRSADVLYAQDPMSVGLPTALASLFLWKKFVLKVVGDYAWEQSRQRFGFAGTLEEFQNAQVGVVPQILRILERWVACRASRVVVPSKYLAQIVLQWGVPAEKIVVIYNGVSVGDVGKRDIIRGVLHFEGKLLISVGHLVPWKGFDVLLKTFAKLRKKFPDAKLFIVGSGTDLQRLEGIVHELGIGESVIFAGAVDHEALMRYIRAADVFVLNSSYEGFSHLVLETMAIGVPVVTTNVGGNPEAVTDGVNGFLVKPNDQSALQSRITQLLEKSDLYKKVVQGGKARVAEFTDEKVLTETARLLLAL